jgi:hypothetical protein
MGLCSLTTRKLDIPGEPGEWIEIRPLSSRARGDIMLAARDAAHKKKIREADLEMFMTVELLCRFNAASVIAWSYPVDLTPESVDDLDGDTASWLFTEIMSEAEVPLETTAPSTESSETAETE